MNYLLFIILRILNNGTYCLIILFFFLIQFSCTFNGTYQNRESDKKDGEEITVAFYKIMQQGEYTKTYSLYTERFFTITDTSKLATLYYQIDSTCGSIRSYSLSEWKTTVVQGSNPNSEYVYLYDVQREYCKTRETISLKKENNNVRIMSYDVQMY